MNVGTLRKLIADLPDSMPVVVPTPDHSYYAASCSVTEAVQTDRRGWKFSETGGDESPLDVVKVLRVGD